MEILMRSRKTTRDGVMDTIAAKRTGQTGGPERNHTGNQERSQEGSQHTKTQTRSQQRTISLHQKSTAKSIRVKKQSQQLIMDKTRTF